MYPLRMVPSANLAAQKKHQAPGLEFAYGIIAAWPKKEPVSMEPTWLCLKIVPP
jgi:hypothetical protein